MRPGWSWSTWPVGIFEELKAAGLVLADRDREWDGRRNVYTLTGAGSGWAVTIPLVSYSRRRFYALQYRIAELERLLAVNPEGATGGQDDGTGGFPVPTHQWKVGRDECLFREPERREKRQRSCRRERREAPRDRNGETGRAE